VRILLPPSEAKRPGGDRSPAGSVATDALSGSSLSGSSLAESRVVVATALVDFSRRDPLGAARALALPARSCETDLADDRELFNSPTMTALDRYAGTVYDGLAARRLTATGRRRAMASVLIFSGLFGVLRADERIPPYRLPVSATRPPIGALTPFWRAALRGRLEEMLGRDDLIVDLRSSDYSAMWRPTGPVRERLVTVRVLSEQPDGRLAVISYPSKHGKGRLARALLATRARVTSTEQVAKLWTDAGGRDATVYAGGRLDLMTSESPAAMPDMGANQP
jgi:cytoplasmic iron level regulating protein YaaA (DUF328/UPF0246 family)